MPNRIRIEWEGASSELLLGDLDQIALRARVLTTGAKPQAEADQLLELAQRAIGLTDPVEHEGDGKSDVLLRLAGAVAGLRRPLTYAEARRRGYNDVIADVDAYIAAGKPEDVAKIAAADFSPLTPAAADEPA